MQFHLPNHISFGFVGSEAVVLDLRADRYYRLANDDAAVLASLAGASLCDDPAAAARLARRGLLASGPGGTVAPVTVRPPAASALETPGDSLAVGAFAVGLGRVAASLSLRHLGLASTIARWRRKRDDRHRAGAAPAAGADLQRRGEAARIARGFAQSRLYIPARRKCVPDSLALMACLWQRDVAADLLFGVRLAPFAAHCWVQADDMLLSDPLDIVREFTPVFRL